MRWIEQYAKTLCHSDICKLSSLELVTVQCAASTIFNCFYVMYTPKTLNSLVDGFIYPLKHMRWAGTWRISEKSHSLCVCFFGSYLRKNQPDSIQWNIYMPVFSVLCINVCLFYILGTVVTCLCGRNAEWMIFRATKLFSLPFFLLSPLLLLLLLFVKMEHTHIYINKNFVAQTFRCRHNALLFTLAQTIFLVSQYVCVLGCYCFYFPVVLPFSQLSFSLSLND